MKEREEKGFPERTCDAMRVKIYASDKSAPWEEKELAWLSEKSVLFPGDVSRIHQEHVQERHKKGFPERTQAALRMKLEIAKPVIIAYQC